MIYQEDIGGNNSGKLPSGGILAPLIVASSMSETVTNPITYYGSWGSVISQIGQSSDLYNYYWTSYSRGTDGIGAYNVANNPLWHNDYLDSYILLRHKSIYDPCPYGYRIPSNGTYNEFTNPGWTYNKLTGGITWSIQPLKSWIAISGGRVNLKFYQTMMTVSLPSSTVNAENNCYIYSKITSFALNTNSKQPLSHGLSVRCIEDCSVVSDATEASAGY